MKNFLLVLAFVFLGRPTLAGASCSLPLPAEAGAKKAACAEIQSGQCVDILAGGHCTCAKVEDCLNAYQKLQDDSEVKSAFDDVSKSMKDVPANFLAKDGNCKFIENPSDSSLDPKIQRACIVSRQQLNELVKAKSQGHCLVQRSEAWDKEANKDSYQKIKKTNALRAALEECAQLTAASGSNATPTTGANSKGRSE